MALHQILALILAVLVVVGAVVLIRRDLRRQRARRRTRQHRDLDEVETKYGHRSDGSVIVTVQEEPERKRRPRRGPRGRHLHVVPDERRGVA